MSEVIKDKEEEAKEIEIKVEETVEDQITEELEMARKHGLIKDEEEEEDESKNEKNKEKENDELKKSEESETDKDEVKLEKDEPAKKEEKVDHSTKLDETFDKMEVDPSVEHEELNKFTSEQKSFYWKWKNDKKKRQEAVAKSELLELELKQLREQKKKEKNLDELLTDEEQRLEDEKPLTRKEYEEEQRKKQLVETKNKEIMMRLNAQEVEARNKYEDFDEAMKAAAPLLKDPMYYNLYVGHAEDPTKNAADFVYKLGKFHLKPKEKTTEDLTEKKERKQTSASLVSAPSNGYKKVSFDELTLEDAVHLTTADWIKIPYATRKRLLAQ